VVDVALRRKQAIEWGPTVSTEVLSHLSIQNRNGRYDAEHKALPEELRVEYPQVNNSLLLLFSGYVFLWYIQIGYRINILGEIRFELVLGSILAFLAFFFTPRVNWDSRLAVSLSVLFLTMIVQVPFSYDVATSWVVFIDRIVKFAVMGFLIVSFVRSPWNLKIFLAAFLVALMKLGFEGFVGTITGSLLWENQGIMRLHGATSIHEDPNSFSGMAVGTLPFIYFLWPVAGRYSKFALVVLALFSLNIILFTGSRTGYVAFIAFVLYALKQNKHKKGLILKCLVLVMICIPFLPSDYTGRFMSIYTMKDKEGHSIDMRKEILRDASDIFWMHPFGVGVGAFPKVRYDTFGRIQDTHNLYLEIATNLGVQGLLAFMLFILTMLKLLNRVKIRTGKYLETLKLIHSQCGANIIEEISLINAVALAVSGFIIVRLTLGIFGMDLYEIYWWFAAALTVSLNSMLSRIDKVMMEPRLQR
jgi:O-antigen ligase